MSKDPIRGDGSDFNWRMRVDDRYKEMAKSRRTLKTASKVQTGYILVRSAWKFAPHFIDGTPVATTDLAILLAGVAMFLFYRYAFGYGKTQHEKLWAIMTCTIFEMIMLAECFLTFWIYHIILGPKSTHPGVAEQYPPIPNSFIAAAGFTGSAAATALKILDPLEKAIDVLGIGSFIVTAVVMRDYAVESRDHKRETESRKAAALKAE